MSNSIPSLESICAAAVVVQLVDSGSEETQLNEVGWLTHDRHQAFGLICKSRPQIAHMSMAALIFDQESINCAVPDDHQIHGLLSAAVAAGSQGLRIRGGVVNDTELQHLIATNRKWSNRLRVLDLSGVADAATDETPSVLVEQLCHFSSLHELKLGHLCLPSDKQDSTFGSSLNICNLSALQLHLGDVESIAPSLWRPTLNSLSLNGKQRPRMPCGLCQAYEI